MEHYAGIDVSLEQSSVCVVGASGRVSDAGMLLLAKAERLARCLMDP